MPQPHFISSEPEHPHKSPSTKCYLEQLNARMVGRVSDHDWTHTDFQDFMDPDYKAYLEYNDIPMSKNRDEYLENFKSFTNAYPDYSIGIHSINADVDDKHGKAKVWLFLRVYGHPKDLVRESVTVVHWRRKKGKWVCYKQNGIRGICWHV